ncbi:hypothetical protein, partial [Flavobacterium sp. T12S277]|uniref:hypothetical protein n=1 Tax=Flavobacterium sp. T12S277 TaxID=3402752 RepID=UPI003AEE2D36
MLKYLLKLINQGKLRLKLCLVFFLFFLGAQEKVSAQNCTANAGGDVTVCGDAATLEGSVAGSLGAGGATWSFVSGPATPTIASPNSFITGITGMSVDGNYIFKLSYPCAIGVSESLVTVTAHPKPASFTAGPDISGICASTGSTTLGGVIPPGFTGTWEAKHMTTFEKYGTSDSYNSSFSDPTSATPTFELINKSNHDIDPAYKVVLTIKSLDGLCTYTDEAVVKFCPNPHINIQNYAQCLYNGSTFLDLFDAPSFNTDTPNSAGAVGNGTTITLNVTSQPAGANISFRSLDGLRMYFDGADILGDYVFSVTVQTACCGSYTTDEITYTNNGEGPSDLNFQPPGHGAPEQLAPYTGLGSAGEVHCGFVGSTTPESFYFDLNPNSDPSTTTTVTFTGDLPPGANTPPTITLFGDGTMSRSASVDPGPDGWKAGTYIFDVIISSGECTNGQSYYMHISDGNRPALFVPDVSVCYPGSGAAAVDITLPAVYKETPLNPTYFYGFGGLYNFTVLSQPAGSDPVVFEDEGERGIGSTSTTVSNLTQPGDYVIRMTAFNGNGVASFLEQEYACSGIPEPLQADFTIHVEEKINSNAGANQTFECSSDVSLQGNGFGASGSTGLWTVVSVPPGAAMPTVVNPTNITSRVNGFNMVGVYTFKWTISSTQGSCTSDDDVVITINTLAPNSPAVTVVQPTCSTPTGSITITDSSPNPDLEFSIDNGVTFQTSNVFANVTVGAYEVVVKSFSIGCTSFPSSATLVTPTCTSVIVATDDTGVSVNGSTGGTSVTNVLTNDTLNGSAVVPSDVNTTFVSATNPGITLSGTDVLVAPNTPAGTYTLTYRICEKLNPTNCDDATVSVTVTAGSIVATDDAGSSINSSTGGTSLTNVLSNDTLNGSAVVPSDVNTTFVSATNPGITLSGTDVLVAPGTPVGTYTLTYRICEKLNPTNCDDAVVTVPVTAGAIVATDDTGVSVNGSTGGTSLTNVLTNDILNGSAVIPSDVNTTFVSATNPGITLSGTDVLVAPNTPAGIYTLTYRICEKLNPTNCDDATVSVTVTAGAIVATDDAGSSVVGSTGGTSLTNVLSNDTLNGSAVVPSDVNTTFVSATNAGITLSGTNVLVAPGTPVGTYTLTYRICEKLNPTNCDDAVVTVPVISGAIVATDDTGSPV